MSDTREFTRVVVHVEVDLDGGNSVESSRTRDLSLNGVFLCCDTPLPEGTECRVSFDLGLESGAAIRAAAKVVRSDAEGMALSFEHLEGPESLLHLQNLVRYNASSLPEVEGEFRRHTGLKVRE